MNFRKNCFLITIAALLSLSGCSTKGNLGTDQIQVQNKLAAKDFEVVIEDSRTNVQDPSLGIPVFTLPGKKNEISPAITIDLEQLFREVMQDFQVPGDRTLVFEIEVREGVMGFRAGAFHEEEYVRTILKVTATDKGTGGDLGSSAGRGWGTRKSLDASPRRLEKMFNRSIRAALIDALQKLTIQ